MSQDKCKQRLAEVEDESANIIMRLQAELTKEREANRLLIEEREQFTQLLTLHQMNGVDLACKVAEQDKEIQELKRKIMILETDSALGELKKENPASFKTETILGDEPLCKGCKNIYAYDTSKHEDYCDECFKSKFNSH